MEDLFLVRGLQPLPCCCLFPEPSGMPAGVWARSVSASEIEVNWQALSYSPERVLGYEVHFIVSNESSNHMHAAIPAPVIPASYLAASTYG